MFRRVATGLHGCARLAARRLWARCVCPCTARPHRSRIIVRHCVGVGASTQSARADLIGVYERPCFCVAARTPRGVGLKAQELSISVTDSHQISLEAHFEVCSMQYHTKQQTQGATRYKPAVLIGNWNEVRPATRRAELRVLVLHLVSTSTDLAVPPTFAKLGQPHFRPRRRWPGPRAEQGLFHTLQDRNVEETVLKDFLAKSHAGTLKIDQCASVACPQTDLMDPRETRRVRL